MRKNRLQSRARPVKCLFCDKPFMTRHSQGKYCAPVCKRSADRASWRLYGKRNGAKRREYHRQFYRLNRDKITDRVRKYQQSESGKISIRHSDHDQLIKFPEKIFARQVVGAAIRAGYMIPQPCEQCGATKADAHHPDYMDPFIVKWLCRKHHLQLHRELKQEVAR